MTSKSVDDFVQSEGRLRMLQGEARRLGRLQGRLDELLPVGVSGCCSVAALRDGVLTLVTSSPAVATSVSQTALRLAVEIRKSEAEVTTIRVVVQPEDARPPARVALPAPPALSDDSRAGLLNLAANVRDPRLKAALEALGAKKHPRI